MARLLNRWLPAETVDPVRICRRASGVLGQEFLYEPNRGVINEKLPFLSKRREQVVFCQSWLSGMIAAQSP